jgi:hypothetical protein
MLFEALQLKSTNTGVARVKSAIFYRRLIEAQSYCMIYRLKSPFTGELKDCEGTYNSVTGTAAYLPDITSLNSAMARACARVEQDTSRKCQNNDVDPIGAALQRDADESLYYVIVLRRRLEDVAKLRLPTDPIDYDYFVYRVNAVGSAVTLVEHSRDNPTRRQPAR